MLALLNTAVNAASLRTAVPNVARAAKRFSGRHCTWELVFHLAHNRSDKPSSIFFDDMQGHTGRLLTELHFRSDLKKISDLEVDAMEIRLIHNPGNTPRHTIILEGKGRHSFIDFNPSEFKLETFANPHETSIIEALMRLATEGKAV